MLVPEKKKNVKIVIEILYLKNRYIKMYSKGAICMHFAIMWVSANVALIFFFLVCPLAISSWTTVHQTPLLCLAAAVQHSFRTLWFHQCSTASILLAKLRKKKKRKKSQKTWIEIFSVSMVMMLCKARSLHYIVINNRSQQPTQT